MSVYRADRPDYLRLALDSVLEQTGPFEVRVYLCLDGPLPLALAKVVAAYDGRLYRTLQNPENIGLARSLNRLIDLLGDEAFVFRMDADDISLPGRFQVQLDWFSSHAELDLIGVQALEIDETGKTTGKRDYPVDSTAAHEALERVTPVMHSCYCARSAVFRDGVRYTNAYLTEDLALLIELDRRGFKFGNVPTRAFACRAGQGFQQRRRSVRRGVSEFMLYSDVIHRRHGPISWRYVFPLGRLGLSLLPPQLAAWLRHQIRSLVFFGVRRRESRHG
jgi:glycosyltransferase involved in cell wall biosynthesis